MKHQLETPFGVTTVYLPPPGTAPQGLLVNGHYSHGKDLLPFAAACAQNGTPIAMYDVPYERRGDATLAMTLSREATVAATVWKYIGEDTTLVGFSSGALIGHRIARIAKKWPLLLAPIVDVPSKITRWKAKLRNPSTEQLEAGVYYRNQYGERLLYTTDFFSDFSSYEAETATTAPGTFIIAATNDTLETLATVHAFAAAKNYAITEIEAGHRAPREAPDITGRTVSDVLWMMRARQGM